MSQLAKPDRSATAQPNPIRSDPIRSDPEGSSDPWKVSQKRPAFIQELQVSQFLLKRVARRMIETPHDLLDEEIHVSLPGSL
jgi:hypothetical protein